jgi:hypothetical protein
VNPINANRGVTLKHKGQINWGQINIVRDQSGQLTLFIFTLPILMKPNCILHTMNKQPRAIERNLSFKLSSSFLLLCLSVLGSPSAMAIEEPAYKIISKAGTFEVRQYAPMMVAETLVEGDMDEASNRGFRRIADYIFGNNQTAQGGAASKIAMTAPVTVEPQSAKIAMTAPVTMGAVVPESGNAAGNTGTAMAASNKWRVHFVMPSQYTLANIPQPKNTDVKLREIPGKLFAVNSYSGLNTESRVQAKTDELSAWLSAQKLKALGSPQLSRYDPPWTLPMFRRNEIMIEVEDLAAAVR